MTFADNLKGQLNDFVDAYKSYFGRTFGVALTFSILCIAASLILVRYSYFPPHTEARQNSIISYFFDRFSSGESYCIADLSKILFIFLVSIFSVGLAKIAASEQEKKELGFSSFIRALTLKDFVSLLTLLLITFFIDFIITRLYGFSTSNILVDRYLRSTYFQLRIYIPLILFASTVHSLITSAKSKINLKRILFLFASLWLFNEFAYETTVWVTLHLFDLLLLPVEDPEKYYFIESFLSIPLIACYFIGFHSAMTTTLRQTERKAVIPIKEEPV